jgi:hypothetical protein
VGPTEDPREGREKYPQIIRIKAMT